MTWSHSTCIALAEQKCGSCFGLGLRPRTEHIRILVCKCVLRAIFRACYSRFESAARRQSMDSNGVSLEVSLEVHAGGKPAPGRVYGRRNEEYLADFVLIARRTLSPELYRIFSWHFLLGADYRAVNRRLRRPEEDRLVFHDFYRIEERLGRAYAECSPHALWPLDEYFGHKVRARRAAEPSFEAQTEDAAPAGKKMRFPLAKRAR